MPLNFLKRTPAPLPVEPVVDQTWQAPVEAVRAVHFVGLTPDRIIEGDILIDDRLSDILNRRDPVAIENVLEAPLDNPEAASASGLVEVDPYEFLVVFAGIGSSPDHSENEKLAHRVRKARHEVILGVAPFEVLGTVHLFAGVQIEELLGRGQDLFLPVTNAEVYQGDQRLGALGLDTVLVNRNDLRAVRNYGTPPAPAYDEPLENYS